MEMIAILIGLTVVLLQAWSFHSYRSQLKNWNEGYEEMVQSGSRSLSSGERSEWMEWIDSRFPQGATSPGNWDRGDAVSRLEDELSSPFAYLFLQRMSVIAPLTGMFITTLGFLQLSIPTDKASLAMIMQTITPLFLGALVGTSLAIINQVLLHFQSRPLEKTRHTALEWFDLQIWGQQQQSLQSSVIGLAQTLTNTAQTIKTTSETMEATTRTQESVSHSLEESIDDLKELLGELKTPVQSFAETLGETRDTINEMNTVLSQTQEVADKHQGALIAFGDAAEDLRQSIPEMNQSMKDFTEIVAKMDELAIDQAKALKEWLASSEQISEQTELRMEASGETVERSVEALEKLITRGLKPLLPQLEGLNELLTSLNLTSVAFQELLNAQDQIEPITQALNDATKIVGEFDQLPARLQNSLDEIPRRFEQLSGEMEQFSTGLLHRQIEDLEALIQPLVNLLAWQSQQAHSGGVNGANSRMENHFSSLEDGEEGIPPLDDSSVPLMDDDDLQITP